MKILLSVFVFIIGFQTVTAQEKRVSGVVTQASDGIPLPGVSVFFKGSKKGTFTDVNGRYSLRVPQGENTLTFTFVGYESKEAEVKTEILNVKLSSSSKSLNEVLVVAYGTANKGTFTGSVSTLSAKDIEKSSVSSISRVLQGNVPGVQSVAPAGQPGSDASIRIRGIGSINASNEPLYVVDGIPYTGSINAINASDVQSISVLKDAAASALYGSRGANGVIIITTKQGNLNAKPVLTLNLVSGVSSRAVKDYDKVNSSQYFELTWEALRNKQLDLGKTAAVAAQYATDNVVNSLKVNPFGAANPNPVGLDGKLLPGLQPLWEDDWGKSVERTGFRQQANLSISGGGADSKYFVSGGYLNDKGFIIGSDFTSYNARLNYNSKINNWFEAGVNLGASSTSQNAPPQSDSQQGNYANFGRLVSSIYPVYVRNTDGSFQYDSNGQKIFDFGNYRPSAAATGNNLLGSSKLNKYNNKQDNLIFRANTQISLLPGLKIKSSINADYSNTNTFNYSNPLYGGSVSTNGSVSKGSNRTVAYTYNNFADYTLQFGKNRLNVLAGQEVYILNYSDVSGSKSNFGFLGVEQPAAASLITGFNGSADNYKLSSFLSKAEYEYDGRYFLTGSFRRDGSSRFSPSSRWGNFWSVGASWNISTEEFLKNTSWLNFLKLRASYGAQGNDNLGSYYQYQALYSIYNSLNNAGLISSTLPTPNLKWETNLNLNIGLDYAVLDNRIKGSFEYYIRRSKDLLFQLPLAPSQGFSSINSNTGSLRNNGFDVNLELVPVVNERFKWTFGINAGHYKNVITSLPVPSIIVANSSVIGPTKQLAVGRSVNEFYIREWAGVDQTTGLPLWYKNVYGTDAQGKQVITGRTTTSVFANADQYYQGSSLPVLTGGISNNFRYQQFELSFLLAYNLGGKILDYDQIMLESNGNAPGRPLSTDLLRRWTPQNTNTDVPRLSTDATNWNSTSTRFLYSATYARLKNVNFSYTLPQTFRDKLRLQNARVFLRGENLLTFYGHKGMDPEQAVDGVTFYRYPAQRTISIGLDVSF
ncbi:SusC/RagA family TonB-linked outer membrane protein [Pedobacter nutrimenti]|jgi:TonB-linked SusC/RagA family outer membrane protein|uniref:TonB-linked SusC/RagA family outer membrane protein n=1 Tax=Pedobacter nutrimenti TaxID=1241337 RepID=A0A318UFX9_9SPHI|nr:TonB-dependent receptor [Pedobacter nutrimenti]PYF75033.1 TonB-linked SusC/RagA family outer membrane protein [Pedobacter nutrimenti]